MYTHIPHLFWQLRDIFGVDDALRLDLVEDEEDNVDDYDVSSFF